MALPAGDGPAAAPKLLALFGFRLVDMGPHRETTQHWWSVFAVDAGSTFEDSL